ncbi:MAG TPA: DUF4278 domain-containing protein [Leptolyngbyaceae cyanobacterium M33_DOE_097]|nr:DUF4278 domain-containing protein [Leptolyngbyaceae cyanobacterium M33_DOE_097]
MTLTFLGQPYETNEIEISPLPSEQTGRYRGASTRFSTSRVAPRANVQLIYRGVSYAR